MIERVQNWEEFLSEYLSQFHGVSFSWGQNDCAQFASGAVVAITGVDPIPQIRGAYNDKPGARRTLKDHGKGTLLATLNHLFPSCVPAFAKRGDLVWHNGCVGVCYGYIALFIGEVGDASGLVTVPMTECKRAWSIG